MSESQTSKSIVVDVPVRVAYNQWTQLETFPEFMSHVDQVDQVDNETAHFKVSIAGKTVEYDAKILKQEPDREVVWQSVNGKKNGGAVTFRPIDETHTEVTLDLMYEPEGIVENVGDMLGVVSRFAKSDLEDFKKFIEARGAETGAWRGRIEPGQA